MYFWQGLAFFTWLPTCTMTSFTAGLLKFLKTRLDLCSTHLSAFNGNGFDCSAFQPGLPGCVPLPMMTISLTTMGFTFWNHWVSQFKVV